MKGLVGTTLACGVVAALWLRQAHAEQTPDPPAAEAAGAPADGPVAELPEGLRPALSLTVTPSEDLHVGDPIQVTIEATAQAGDRISVPPRELSGFEVLDRKASQKPEGNQVTHVFTLTLMRFDAGAVELPAFEVRVVTPDQQIGSVYTEPHPLEIHSYVSNEPNAELAAATQPVEVIEDDYTLAWVGAGLLAALLVGALGYWFARYRARQPKPEPPPPPPRPAWEIALRRLEHLRRERDTWVQEGRAAEYVDNVSDVVRQYLGARYGFDGLESTTDEVVAILTRQRPRELPLTDVVTLLSDCDLVKFAKAEPDPAFCADVDQQATRMVQRSMPRVEVDERGGQ